MKRLILVGIILTAMVIALCPQVILAASHVHITVTATGSEVDVTCNWSAWAVGTVHASDNVATPFTEGTLTNAGSEAVDVTIFGENMTDNLTTTNWVLSSAGTPGAATFAIKGGPATANVTVKQELATPYNYLLENVAAGGADNFGLTFYSPSSTLGNVEMRMMAAGDLWSGPTGLTLTGSVHV